MFISNVDFMANSLGILALLTSGLVFYPLLMKMSKLFVRQLPNNLQIVRIGLFTTIAMGLVHGLLMSQKPELNFYNLKTYWVYAEGIFTFNLFVLLAFCFSQLKSDRTKLNYFLYSGVLLLVCHLWTHI